MMSHSSPPPPPYTENPVHHTARPELGDIAKLKSASRVMSGAFAPLSRRTWVRPAQNNAVGFRSSGGAAWEEDIDMLHGRHAANNSMHHELAFQDEIRRHDQLPTVDRNAMYDIYTRLKQLGISPTAPRLQRLYVRDSSLRDRIYAAAAAGRTRQIMYRPPPGSARTRDTITCLATEAGAHLLRQQAQAVVSETLTGGMISDALPAAALYGVVVTHAEHDQPVWMQNVMNGFVTPAAARASARYLLTNTHAAFAVSVTGETVACHSKISNVGVVNICVSERGAGGVKTTSEQLTLSNSTIRAWQMLAQGTGASGDRLADAAAHALRTETTEAALGVLCKVLSQAHT